MKMPRIHPVTEQGSALDVKLAADTRPVIRWGLIVLGLGFGGFLLWASLAPLDEGVPAPGIVSIETHRKAVQHLTGGIIQEVRVREAQEVKAGDVLIRLDDTQVRANHDALKQQYYALLAQEGRLRAEQMRSNEVTFPPELTAAKSDPSAQGYMTLQKQLFHTRRLALQAELASMDEGIAAYEAQIAGLEAQLEGRSAQLRLVNEQLAGTRDLAKEGFAPRNKLFEEERLAAELSGQVNDLRATIARTRSSIAELRLRREQRRQEFLREVESQLADTRRERTATAERLAAARVELERTEIRAPADGQVVGLLFQTVGAVIPPGAKIMDIVPKNEQLVLEVQVAPHLIDRIHTGLPADIRFQTFADLPQLVVEGKVISVSADRLTDPATNLPYYLARVAVLPEGMKKLGNRQLQPGMPVEVVIKTGERTLLNYLLRPLLRRVSTSMTEH